MAARGVLIQCIPSTAQDKLSVCSGVLFSNRWVLTLGTILDFHVNKKKEIGPEVEEFEILESSPSEIQIIRDKSALNEHRFNVIVENEIAPPASLDGSCPPGNECPVKVTPYKWHVARLVAMWGSPILSAAIHTILSDWQMKDPDGDKSASEQKTQSDSKTLLSSFLLFHLDSSIHDEECKFSALDVKNVVMRLFQQIAMPARGQEVVFESTLFGREFFLNSLSQGIISNKVGQRGCLLLTDARSAVGCEGGPIFTNTTHRSLLGLVLSSLSWWKGEWVGFTLGVALHPVLAYLCLGGHEPKVYVNRSLSTSNLASLEKSVVLVRCGQSWGSGVVIDAAAGLLLTCSHVVKNTSVGVGGVGDVGVVWQGRKLDATLVYRSPDGVAYDLAVLRLIAPAPGMQQATLGSPPQKGEPVYVVGYPLFSERGSTCQQPPTLTRGIISHVSPAVMLQTTCCVQSGASGAPVLRPNGDLLALVSCNARDLSSGALYPHVNMAVPVDAFRAPLLQFVRTGEVAVLSKLEEQDELIQKMWRLNFTTSSL